MSVLEYQQYESDASKEVITILSYIFTHIQFASGLSTQETNKKEISH